MEAQRKGEAATSQRLHTSGECRRSNAEMVEALLVKGETAIMRQHYIGGTSATM